MPNKFLDFIKRNRIILLAVAVVIVAIIYFLYQTSINKQAVTTNNTAPQKIEVIPEKETITTPAIPVDLLQQFVSTNLPYKTNDYDIYWDKTSRKIIITPNIGVGDTSYQRHLIGNWDSYKAKALTAISWIKSKGLKITDNDIDFLDRGLWPDGETISVPNP
jgi:hypothetical protein